jgi:hypothetical protein
VRIKVGIVTPEVPKKSVLPVFTSEKPSNDGNENPTASTPTKKARKPKKKSKKGKKQTTEEPLDESKPVSIAMIGAVAFRSLAQTTVVAVYKFIKKPFAVTVRRPQDHAVLPIHCMHRQIPLACLGRSCIATVNAPAYEESAHLQYFPHLGQSLPRFDWPESLLHGPEIPPWASLPLVESAAHLL